MYQYLANIVELCETAWYRMYRAMQVADRDGSSNWNEKLEGERDKEREEKRERREERRERDSKGSRAIEASKGCWGLSRLLEG